ncbi:MAG: 2-oxo acid dehydrogenase subunit E2, partial [Deltaproteobacteria bacterium]|nr:2-oxo acid dehydrogenase subunit E2 [Deltaproteobacteria bacterium]
MPTPIVMPKLADDMREGKILSWKKKEGDPVESGEVIAEVETDKANLDV